MDYVDLLLRWIHILAAVAAAGGIIFWRLVLVPAVQSLNEGERHNVLESVRGPWAKLVMLATLLLLVTGIINAVRIIQSYALPSTYHALVMVKLVLAMAFFYLIARLSGRSAAAAQYRERLPFWMSVALALVLGMVLVAGYMKNIPRSLKSDAGTSVQTSQLAPAQLDSVAHISLEPPQRGSREKSIFRLAPNQACHG